MIIGETVHTADNTPDSEFVAYAGTDLTIEIRRGRLDQPPPANLVVSVATESYRLVRGRAEPG